jgi:hypothetical protein
MEETAKKLRQIIDNTLNTGDWNNSIFLKQAAMKLRNLLLEADRLSKIFATQPAIAKKPGAMVKTIKSEVPADFVQVYVLLYQIDGANLTAWHENIKSLVGYSANRSVYKNQDHIEEFIRAKNKTISCSGYVVINVKSNDFYHNETPTLDIYNHELLILKEDAIKLENIVEFVLANKQHYRIENNKLVLSE